MILLSKACRKRKFTLLLELAYSGLQIYYEIPLSTFKTIIARMLWFTQIGLKYVLLMHSNLNNFYAGYKMNCKGAKIPFLLEIILDILFTSKSYFQLAKNLGQLRCTLLKQSTL